MHFEREEVILITQNEVNIIFNEQVRLCADTMKRKTREYTGDEEDRLCAFKAAAALLHTTPERALAGMMRSTSYPCMICVLTMAEVMIWIPGRKRLQTV